MKLSIFKAALLLQSLIIASPLYAQYAPETMARIYQDNDFLNDKGKGTDEAYSNGSRIDIFYTKKHGSKLFIDRWMPQAGDSSVNTYGLSISEVMYTPHNIGDRYYQPHDYAWASGMYLIHSLYSYSPQKKYDYQTEILAGVMGPAAMAKQMQTLFHSVINDPTFPRGWDNQFGNDLLLNVNLTGEKELAHIGNFVELIGSAQVQAGTMADAVDIAPVLVFGKMNTYFNGFGTQYSSKGPRGRQGGHIQAYFKVRPGVQLVAWNSMLEGGMFNQHPSVAVRGSSQDPGVTPGDSYITQPVPQIENLVTYLCYSFVLVTGPFSISYSQTHTSELVKNTYAHTYGNISLVYSW